MDTLPLHLGAVRCKTILISSAFLGGLIQVVAVLMGIMPFGALGFVIAPLFLVLSYLALEKQAFPSELSVRVISDGSLFLAGLLPYLLMQLLKGN